nr:MAG TPA: hypothetical protein [Caudoviricetes sp.]
MKVTDVQSMKHTLATLVISEMLSKLTYDFALP